MKYLNKILVVLTVCALFCGGAGLLDAGSFKLPAYEKFVLKNGLTVYLLEQHEVPLLTVSVVLPAGSVKDNGKYGLANLTADALLFGTKSLTKAQIEEKLDYLGVGYGTSATTEFARVTMRFTKDDKDVVLPILKDILVQPVFDAKEFEKHKKRSMMQLDLAKERPSSVMRFYFNKFLFGDHGYGNPTFGTKGAVEKITIAEIKAFYKANYKPSESAIAIVGDFKTADMKKQVETLFAAWKAEGAAAKMEDKALPTFAKSRVLLINKEDATETQFYIGGKGVKRSNPDFVPIQVINTILGGR
ncbi:MAG: insulinase family protein, partial [bacterium]|nr:insulinase family protein [bacterium]